VTERRTAFNLPATERRTAFHDLPAEAFPMTIEFWDDDTGELLESMRIEGPGTAEVRSWAPRRVRVRAMFANGRVESAGPPK
jgi:hypothetical protein